jgi:DUF4097 and DUF4098 domain-containing protein YvlB
MKKLVFTLIIIAIANIANSQNKQNEFHLNKTYPLANNGTIYLSAHDAEVTIIGENRSDVAVKIDYFVTTKGIQWGSKDFQVEVENRGSDLYIKEYRSGNTTVMGYISTEYKIEIKAPVGSSLDIDGDDDDYLISSINGEISINADDADVRLKNCQGERFFFDLDDGDVFMDAARGKLTARMDDGDIEILNAALENIDFRGDDGDVAIETSIGPNAMYKFSGDDATFDIVVTRGGGTFTIKHDNGNIDYDNNFRLMEKGEDLTVLSLTGGRARIVISGDDIRVNLASTQSN